MADETENPILTQIESSISAEDYMTFPNGKVVCNLTLGDGRQFDGNSGSENFGDDDLKKLARAHAISKIWSGRIR